MGKPRLNITTNPGRKSGSLEPKSCILLAKLCLLSKKTFKTKFTQDHCGEGGLVLSFVHSCRPEASLHMYLSVGRPLRWNSVQGVQGHLQQSIKRPGKKNLLFVALPTFTHDTIFHQKSLYLELACEWWGQWERICTAVSSYTKLEDHVNFCFATNAFWMDNYKSIKWRNTAPSVSC